jgi:hypothetical protein
MEIKDSGTSIPGHGGFLDRFDGLLLSAPFIVTFLRLFGMNDGPVFSSLSPWNLPAWLGV